MSARKTETEICSREDLEKLLTGNNDLSDSGSPSREIQHRETVLDSFMASLRAIGLISLASITTSITIAAGSIAAGSIAAGSIAAMMPRLTLPEINFRLKDNHQGGQIINVKPDQASITTKFQPKTPYQIGMGAEPKFALGLSSESYRLDIKSLQSLIKIRVKKYYQEQPSPKPNNPSESAEIAARVLTAILLPDSEFYNPQGNNLNPKLLEDLNRFRDQDPQQAKALAQTYLKLMNPYMPEVNEKYLLLILHYDPDLYPEAKWKADEYLKDILAQTQAPTPQFQKSPVSKADPAPENQPNQDPTPRNQPQLPPPNPLPQTTPLPKADSVLNNPHVDNDTQLPDKDIISLCWSPEFIARVIGGLLNSFRIAGAPENPPFKILSTQLNLGGLTLYSIVDPQGKETIVVVPSSLGLKEGDTIIFGPSILDLLKTIIN